MSKINALLMFVFILSSGCSWTQSKMPSILIIAVESLPFESITCEEYEKNNEGAGFQKLCNESIRFTHAYTTSPLAVPALASILTAQYPNEHNVRHNGSNYLSEEVLTLAELAKKKGYSTSLFSSGMPILRKTGLGQGFEVFNDQIPLSLTKFHRSVGNSVQLQIQWLLKNSGAFFSVIYINDLLFPQRTTKTNANVERTKSRTSQLLEVSESLDRLFNYLKKSNRWDNTYIVLAGLNGYQKIIDPKNPPPMSLTTQNTLVNLQMKPIYKDKRDLPQSWKVDKNVTLADVGSTFLKILESDNTTLESSPSLFKPDSNIENDRLVVIESSWPTWQLLGPPRLAARKKHYISYYESPMKIYNSLTDKVEKIPVESSHPMWNEIYIETKNFFQKNNFNIWQQPDPQTLEKFFIGHSLWAPKHNEESFRNLIALHKRRPWDDQTAGWLAMQYLEKKQWLSLKKLGIIKKNIFWISVAKKNLKEPVRKNKKGCVKYFTYTKTITSPTQKQCQDKLLIKAIQWVKNDNSKYFNQFWREYKYRLTQQSIAKLNYYYFLVWDTSSALPEGPLLADLFLNLPKNNKFKKILDKKIASSKKSAQLLN